MTEKMGGEAPQGLPPEPTNAEVNKTKAQLVADAKAKGIKVPSRANKAEVQELLEAHEADSNADDSTEAAASSEPSVGLFDDIDEDIVDVSNDDSDETSDDADSNTDNTDNTDDTDQATDDTDESNDFDEAPVGLADEQDTDELDQAEGQTEDFDDYQPQWADDDDASEPGAIKAALGRINLRSRRTWVIIIGVLAVLALIAASVVISLDRSNDDAVDAADPAVTVDDVFSGLCETTGDVDLTIMPIAGFSLDGLNVNSDADAATTQSRVVDDYFVDTSLGCSPQGIEFLRAGVDQSRIDADRPGLDTRDSAGRIVYYGDHSEEALVVAEYLNKVMSECAAEMVVLSEADVQDGLFVLTFTNGSYEDLVWGEDAC